MNVLPSQPHHRLDWVINYVEINSRPATTAEFRRLRITENEIQLAPAGIVLSIQGLTDQGLLLCCGDEQFHSSIVQRGNELILRMSRPSDQGSIMIVAKRSVCEFEPASAPVPMASFAALLES